MTTTNAASNSAQYISQLGTLSVIPWTSDPTDSERNSPYLLAYSLGDGRGGPGVVEETMRAVLGEVGLRPGEVVDLTEEPGGVSVKLLVEAGRAVLTMPYLNAQCPVPPEWERDARETGKVYFVVATRPWAEAVPGRPVDEERLRAFAGDPEMLAAAAHCVVPVRSLRG
ncbi:DUF5949 family protein [Streptomyces paludis]|uniref:Uncharacterized protein n=1 Tax=Streptomyces paludis TaxID=2282738 RepID=A0A345HSC7_9ACTN|nr:DUF5949 family protein [Streptomyces paludis]AXG79601.1 hypothetical protein DVK44_20280 [Streptomyces paludis]